MTDITPFLWYAKDVEEAVRFYCSVVPNSHIDFSTTLPSDSPSGPGGSVVLVHFTLAGRKFQAMAAGPLDPFNHAVSFLIECDGQEELDRVWAGLLEGGGKEQQCGWLCDRYGLYWQLVPKGYFDLMRDPDRTKAKRLTDAMLTMVKLDWAALQKAFNGG
jgi:predicted 3-demethylubiquinone-9 3-methyltransferase (glyoxalase superfamily)